jgi:hypothetical protein
MHIILIKSPMASTTVHLQNVRLTKRQVSKRPVSKRLKRQVYKMSGLQNVGSSKRPVAKKHL